MHENFSHSIVDSDPSAAKVESGPYQDFTRTDLEDQLAAFYARVLQLENQKSDHDTSAEQQQQIEADLQATHVEIKMMEEALATLPGGATQKTIDLEIPDHEVDGLGGGTEHEEEAA